MTSGYFWIGLLLGFPLGVFIGSWIEYCARGDLPPRVWRWCGRERRNRTPLAN